MNWIVNLFKKSKKCELPNFKFTPPPPKKGKPKFVTYYYYEKELDKISKLDISEMDLHKQITVLKDFADKLGLEKAKKELDNL